MELSQANFAELVVEINLFGEEEEKGKTKINESVFFGFFFYRRHSHHIVILGNIETFSVIAIPLPSL